MAMVEDALEIMLAHNILANKYSYEQHDCICADCYQAFLHHFNLWLEQECLTQQSLTNHKWVERCNLSDEGRHAFNGDNDTRDEQEDASA